MPHYSSHFRDLLIAICLFLVGYPLLVGEGLVGKSLEAFFGLAILRAGLMASPGFNRNPPFFVKFLIVVLIGCWLGEIIDAENSVYEIFRKLLLMFFFIRFITIVGRDVFITQRIDVTNRLYGAICIYLLLATTFADLFMIQAYALPHAFNCSTALCDQSADIFHDGTHLYFSLITLATVGYGDITPTHPLTAITTAIEAVIGQMYIGIVIARLVGLHLLEAENGTKKKN